MGNLGGYQTIVTVVKKLGGPVQATTIVVGGSFALGAAVLAGGQKVLGKAQMKLAEKIAPNTQFFEVTEDVKDEKGFKLSAGDKYRVFERDGDVLFIEVIGRDDNPHVASAKFLRSVSRPLADDV